MGVYVCVCIAMRVCDEYNLNAFDATIPSSRSTEVRQLRMDYIDGLSYEHVIDYATYALLPTSLAVTKGILVSFYYCAAPTDMFKFSAYPHSS